MTAEPPPAPEPEERDPDEEIPPAPWSFKIMVALAALHQPPGQVQDVVWVIERVF